MPIPTRARTTNRRSTGAALAGVAAALTALPAAPVAASATPATAASAGRAAAGAPVQVALPAPTGPRPVGTVALRLVDRGRKDPLAPSKPYRELMVSLWYPARATTGLPVAPQMTAGAAAAFDRDTAPDLGLKPGEVAWAATRTHARAGAPVDTRAGRLPVILFSPGFEAPRTLSTVLAEDLASRGYAVVTVDHTYEAEQVEFPGGRVETSRLPVVRTPEEQAKLFSVLLPARVADLRFVLDRLADLDRGTGPRDAAPLPDGLRGALDLSRVGAFGHSMGGSTAAQLAHDDRRVDAGANLDGIVFDPVASTGVSKPFLQVAGGTTTRASEPSWKSFWEASTGWKREARFTGTQHFSFFDLQAMLPQISAELGHPATAETIGTIDPRRSVAAQRAYLAAFFDLHLKGRRTPLFDGPSAAYPEVRLIP
ncbi:alpha/beta hydrolase family protein [Nonomuraea pusilla]|uniref:Alpha/beta hydrolase family protein n=1 Tax=Nonomuraea pusilla TaxID=46177 RepID=A0A1H8DD13_9ACTN|nr:lipase [Nonomuraea pusilla]SEN04367.1 Alpha/beta hydrolase family protein [Nonomuraea pusilla]